jgi:heavy metal sensor kinase
MILKSIKWRLQLWYGVILIAVLAGFGTSAYQLERGRQFRRIDDEIHLRIRALTQQLHHPPRGPLPGRFPDEGPPPEFPDDGGPDGTRPPPRFLVTPQIAALFDPNALEEFYFVVTGRDGREMARSTNAPAGRADDQEEPRPEYPGGPGLPVEPLARTRGDYRELGVYLPSDERILVGRNIKPEREELRLTALRLAGFGGVILFVGLTGGWWLVGRALRPIAEISSAAAKISAGDLAQRISAADTESELGQLAAVLNSTFGRLETAFAQQQQFAADAAHELRTPVSVILTQTQTALARERDAAGYRQTVEACQRAAQRMRRLIESLLELARFDAGQEVMQRLKFDLAKTVANGVEMVQPLAAEQGVRIITELEPLAIPGDSERLTQVVTNLLTNAIQFSPRDGEVRVRLATREGMAILEVSDPGKGIAPEDLRRVFERFYRADKSRTGAGNSGLGLAICKSIVEAHGGTIEAASGGQGATFTLRLPVEA